MAQTSFDKSTNEDTTIPDAFKWMWNNPKKVGTTALEMTPIIGDALLAKDAVQSFSEGDIKGGLIDTAALGVGLIPVVGDITAKGIKQLKHLNVEDIKNLGIFNREEGIGSIGYQQASEKRRRVKTVILPIDEALKLFPDRTPISSSDREYLDSMKNSILKSIQGKGRDEEIIHREFKSKGVGVPFVSVDFDKRGNTLLSKAHEAAHRILALKELGHKFVPVDILFNKELDMKDILKNTQMKEAKNLVSVEKFARDKKKIQGTSANVARDFDSIKPEDYDLKFNKGGLGTAQTKYPSTAYLNPDLQQSTAVPDSLKWFWDKQKDAMRTTPALKWLAGSDEKEELSDVEKYVGDPRLLERGRPAPVEASQYDASKYGPEDVNRLIYEFSPAYATEAARLAKEYGGKEGWANKAMGWIYGLDAVASVAGGFGGLPGGAVAKTSRTLITDPAKFVLKKHAVPKTTFDKEKEMHRLAKSGEDTRLLAHLQKEAGTNEYSLIGTEISSLVKLRKIQREKVKKAKQVVNDYRAKDASLVASGNQTEWLKNKNDTKTAIKIYNFEAKKADEYRKRLRDAERKAWSIYLERTKELEKSIVQPDGSIIVGETDTVLTSSGRPIIGLPIYNSVAEFIKKLPDDTTGKEIMELLEENKEFFPKGQLNFFKNYVGDRATLDYQYLINTPKNDFIKEVFASLGDYDVRFYKGQDNKVERGLDITDAKGDPAIPNYIGQRFAVKDQTSNTEYGLTIHNPAAANEDAYRAFEHFHFGGRATGNLGHSRAAVVEAPLDGQNEKFIFVEEFQSDNFTKLKQKLQENREILNFHINNEKSIKNILEAHISDPTGKGQGENLFYKNALGTTTTHFSANPKKNLEKWKKQKDDLENALDKTQERLKNEERISLQLKERTSAYPLQNHSDYIYLQLLGHIQYAKENNINKIVIPKITSEKKTLDIIKDLRKIDDRYKYRHMNSELRGLTNTQIDKIKKLSDDKAITYLQNYIADRHPHVTHRAGFTGSKGKLIYSKGIEDAIKKLTDINLRPKRGEGEFLEGPFLVQRKDRKTGEILDPKVKAGKEINQVQSYETKLEIQGREYNETRGVTDTSSLYNTDVIVLDLSEFFNNYRNIDALRFNKGGLAMEKQMELAFRQ